MSQPIPLDNPIWSALISDQSHFALGGEHAKRYPADVAPFIAVAEPSAAAAQAASDLIAPGEVVNFVSVCPPLDTGWKQLGTGHIMQMAWRDDAPAPSADDSEIVKLGPADLDDMIALTTRVFPGYFRPRTPEMGNYYGLRQNSTFASMSGERMKLTGCVEVSAVCTHPEFTGRNLAARLVNHVTSHILARGLLPFLHVNETNQRARQLYERLGFYDRARLPLWLMQRL